MTGSGASDSSIASDLGARLRLFREAAGLTQQELADRMHCSRKQVSRWEIGQTPPNRARLLRLEAPLGLAPGTLVEVLDSLDSQARARRLRRVSQLFEEGFGAHSDLAAAALGDGGPAPLPLTERRLGTWTDVVEALIQLAVVAAQRPPRHQESVTLISGHWTVNHIHRNHARKRWKLSIQALLASGWRIQHVWCGPALPAFEEWIVDFLGFEGRYELSTVGRGGVIPTFVLLDIPGVGGLIAFVRRDSPDVSAWVSTGGPILDLVHDAAIYALAAGQLVPNRQFVEYEGADEVAPGLTRAQLEMEIQTDIGERLPGEQLFLKDGLPNSSQPADVAIQLRENLLAGASSEEAAGVRSFYDARLRRIHRFEEWVRNDSIRIICSLEAIDEFMATGCSPVDSLAGGPPTVKDPLLRGAWIENVIRLLKDHPRTFRLALVDLQMRPVLRRAQWQTVGERCVFFVVGGRGSKTKAYGQSFEYGVVSTFRGIFEDLWEALPRSAYDSRLVIAQLERALERASEHAASPSSEEAPFQRR